MTLSDAWRFVLSRAISLLPCFLTHVGPGQLREAGGAGPKPGETATRAGEGVAEFFPKCGTPCANCVQNSSRSKGDWDRTSADGPSVEIRASKQFASRRGGKGKNLRLEQLDGRGMARSGSESTVSCNQHSSQFLGKHDVG